MQIPGKEQSLNKTQPNWLKTLRPPRPPTVYSYSHCPKSQTYRTIWVSSPHPSLTRQTLGTFKRVGEVQEFMSTMNQIWTNKNGFAQRRRVILLKYFTKKKNQHGTKRSCQGLDLLVQAQNAKIKLAAAANQTQRKTITLQCLQQQQNAPTFFGARSFLAGLQTLPLQFCLKCEGQ